MSLIKERFARPVLWLAAALVVGANVFNIGADLGSMAEAVPAPDPPAVRGAGGRVRRRDRAARGLRQLRPLLADPALARPVDLRVRARAVRRRRRTGPRSRPDFIPELPADPRVRRGARRDLRHHDLAVPVRLAGAPRRSRSARPGGCTTGRRRQIRAMRVDVVSGMSAGVLVMFAIMVSSAATLGAHGSQDVADGSRGRRGARTHRGSVRLRAVRRRHRRHGPARDPDARGFGGVRAGRDVRLARGSGAQAEGGAGLLRRARRRDRWSASR